MPACSGRPPAQQSESAVCGAGPYLAAVVEHLGLGALVVRLVHMIHPTDASGGLQGVRAGERGVLERDDTGWQAPTRKRVAATQRSNGTQREGGRAAGKCCRPAMCQPGPQGVSLPCPHSCGWGEGRGRGRMQGVSRFGREPRRRIIPTHPRQPGPAHSWSLMHLVISWPTVLIRPRALRVVGKAGEGQAA